MAHEENIVPDTSWDRCIPHYADPPMYLKHLRSMLAVGSFVSISENDGEHKEETQTIYRLVSDEATTVERNKFAPFSVCNLSRAPIAEGWSEKELEER